MSNDQEVNHSSLHQYEAAYLAHYTTQDLNKAFELYKRLLTDYPNSIEAVYSRTQVMNIAHSVIPAQLFLDAQIALLAAHFESDNRPDVESVQAEGNIDG